MIEEGKLTLDRFKLNRRLGCAVFSRTFVLKNKVELFSQEMIDLLNNERQWIIDRSHYEKCGQIFQHMEVCLILRLCFQDFDIPRPIKDIQRVKFINLTQLHLIKNRICSIEPLSKMHFPKLLILDLSRNVICNLWPLRKMYFPMLSGLYISGNHIHSLLSLNACSLPNLDILQLQWYNDDLSDNCCSWISKCNFVNLRLVRCQSNTRISQKNLYKMLKKWFASLTFIISKQRNVQFH